MSSSDRKIRVPLSTKYNLITIITLANKLKKKIVTDLIIGALGFIIPSNYEFNNENSSSPTNFELQANNFLYLGR
jgi:hypothetical protein